MHFHVRGRGTEALIFRLPYLIKTSLLLLLLLFMLSLLLLCPKSYVPVPLLVRADLTELAST